MRVKVCGLTQMDQLRRLDELGVTFGGMIFYPKSPRFVLRHMNSMEVKKYKGKINKVGVFVNATYDEIMNHADNFGLHMVQLHGDETPKFCDRLSEQLEVIKAFRIGPDDHINFKIRHYEDACDVFLFDTAGETYGGTGRKFDWDALHTANIEKPFLLSGGIGPDDATVVKNFQSGNNGKWLFGTDINSKFETAPGLKDVELVKKFVEELKIF
ncbi:MAG: phosphoribosylanthranilate isomerase [Bacteroidota bacterium]